MLKNGEILYRHYFEEQFRRFVKDVETRMKENAPVRRGILRDSIRVLDFQIRQVGDRHVMSATVGPTVPYAEFVEMGTRPSPGRFIYWPGHGNPPFGVRRKKEPRGRHPGTPKQPFMQKTADEMSQVRLPHLAKQVEVDMSRRWDDLRKQSEGL